VGINVKVEIGKGFIIR